MTKVNIFSMIWTRHTWNKPLIKDSLNLGIKIDEKPNTRGKIHRCLETHFDLKQKQKIRGKLAEMANHFRQLLHKWSWINTGIQDDRIRNRELNFGSEREREPLTQSKNVTSPRELSLLLYKMKIRKHTIYTT